MEREKKIVLFGDGEWIDEPDYVSWKHKDYVCEIMRNGFGSLCGYVTLPESHPWYGNEMEEIHVEVHGGLTFNMVKDERHIIGFDCAHKNDVIPAVKEVDIEMQKISPDIYERLTKDATEMKIKEIQTYKNIEFVKNECEKLVDQLIDVKENK